MKDKRTTANAGKTALWYVSKSPIHGTGVYARVPIAKNMKIDVLSGIVYANIQRTYAEVMGNPNWIKLSARMAIDPALPFSKINHSCTPNVGIRGSRTFVAVRDIKKDEELTFDYSTNENDPRWFMRCSCGSAQCRDVIRSIHFLNRKSFNRMYHYIPTYFQKLYCGYHIISRT